MSVFFSQQSLIVAPNERQALALWEADAQVHRAAGDKAWETLAVCSWTEFLAALWEEHWLGGDYQSAPASLMNEWQERFLWMKVISESVVGEQLLNLPAAAKLAAEAWKLTQSYRLERELWNGDNYWSDETEVFKTWVEAFRAQCQKRNWLETCRLENALADLLAQGILKPRVLPRQVRLLGFAEWTPSALAFLQALGEAGVKVSKDEEPAPPPEDNWRRMACGDEEEEIQTACRWLRRQLEGASGSNLKVGLVVPNLAERREEIHRILLESFQPHQLLAQEADKDPPFDFSVGLPLSVWPVIKHALKFLKMDGDPASLEEWLAFVGSPFLGESEKELHSRALLQSRLLRDGRYRVEWNRVAYHAEQEERPYCCPALARRLDSAKSLRGKIASYQLPSDWSTHFSECLETLGWPGQRSLNSSEYQTVKRWKASLTQLGSLDPILGKVTRKTALSALLRIADESVFQPKSVAGCVEVLGPLEAVGLNFDYMWLAGLTDGTWPANSKPNPYLPFSLQKERRVAHSTPERELEFSRLVTRRLFLATRYGVASFPLHTQEETCRPSPLVAQLQETTMEKLKLTPFVSVAKLFWQSRKAELHLDPGPPTVALNEISKGGTAIFKDQSACPFRAYTYSRLNARPEEKVHEGLDPRQRGKLIHSAMEALWKEVKSQSRWLGLSVQEREEVFMRSAERAVELVRKERPDVVRGAMIALERNRVLGLLKEWMELELSREPFQVLSTEEKVKLQFAGLTLSATIDRIDRLHDGNLAVIDYKTGNVSEKDWLGERPKDPQLPLYSVAQSQSVDVICFAVVKTGKMHFRGLARTEDKIPGVKASEQAEDGSKDWTFRQAEWKERLEALAREFRAGHVMVQPAEGEISCKYCGLQGLCRIDERLQETEPS